MSMNCDLHSTGGDLVVTTKDHGWFSVLQIERGDNSVRIFMNNADEIMQIATTIQKNHTTLIRDRAEYEAKRDA